MNFAHPLAWPIQRPRTREPVAAIFRQRGRPVNFDQGAARVALELSRFQASGVVVTSDRPPRGLASIWAPSADPGVAVYFRLNGNPHCLSCDRWDRIPDNLCAIAKHLEAIRGQLRWGAADVTQIFAGFKEIAPAAAAERPWWVVLGFAQRPTSRTDLVLKYQELALRHHPDRGGDAEVMKSINVAYECGLEDLP
jgi:hypothetical protein